MRIACVACVRGLGFTHNVMGHASFSDVKMREGIVENVEIRDGAEGRWS
jgi:hypothetical protein